MSILNLKTTMPAGTTAGRWELIPDGPYVVGGVEFVANAWGLLSTDGTLKGPDGVADASVPLPAYPTSSGMTGLLIITFASSFLPARPIRIELRETSSGVMDVATLINAGRPAVITPSLPPFVPTSGSPT